MKNSLKTFKVFVTGVWMFAFSLSFLFSSANNIRINGTVQVTQGTGDTLVLSFPLRWDNSWRDQFNWDAAWVFFKYKSGTGGWNHVNLCAGGHRFTDGSGLPLPFDCMAGNTGSSTVGLFIYRNTLDAGNTPEIVCQIKCLKSSLGGLTVEQFQKHEGFVLAQAVEMVYVPYGGYYLGDGECSNRFAGGSDGSPVLIDSEEAITASTATKVYPVSNNTMGTAQSIAAVYPKGYKGFYMMKYEVSQEQWVYFLNTLTYVQQQERVPNLATLKGGDYIFGSKNEPSNRNGIIVAELSYNDGAVIFSNNLNNNGVYSEDRDGKTIACNYLSPGDMLAYCSWAGLRPMSELEYEKACRSSYPEQPIKGEYAWHDNRITGRLNAVSNNGLRTERSGTANANVNAGNAFGPVRCGLFATGTSTQQGAGVAFWGGMEMSGNVKEMCYNVAYTAFNGSTMGTGTYNTALWSVTPAHFGVRGGGFSSADSLLRVSDRTEVAGYFADINKRDSTAGFRGVRSIGNDVTVTQGKLVATVEGVNVTTVCPGMTVDIMTDAPAKVMSGGNQISNMDISYIWYVLKPGATVDSIIPGANGATLSYNDFANSGATVLQYKFKRKALCTMGEDITGMISVGVATVPVEIPSLPSGYYSVIGTQFDLPCLTTGDLHTEWKSANGNILNCVSATATIQMVPVDYRVYYVNPYGCAGPDINVTVAGYNLPSIPKHAKEYLTVGATLDGVYVLDPDGAGGEKPAPVYCNMKNDGGGWMLIVNSPSNTPVTTLVTANAYNAPYEGHLYMPYKYPDAWINLIKYDSFWTEARNACGDISNSYWKASECNGGGIFSTLNGCRETQAAYSCYKRYADPAFMSGMREGTYKRCMFDNDIIGTATAYLIWPYHCSTIYIDYGLSCNYTGAGTGEYRIWVR